MTALRIAWIAAFVMCGGVRLWNGLFGPLLRGYDDHGHLGYVLYLHLYRSIPWADQGWSYFHPPLHYLFGWGLAQLGSPEAILHGLALLNGASSLAIAWIASRMVLGIRPDRPGLALLVFVSVGMLPVYLYTSTMAGNELTAAFFGTAAFGLFVANECRDEPELRLDVVVGLLFGLALLSKVNAVLVLGATGLALGLRLLRQEHFFAAIPRIVVRGVTIAGIAIVAASPYYARNAFEFGTPFKMSRDNPHVVRLESKQKPGNREWIDFFVIPASLLVDPNPRADHLLHSVWGSAYAQTWADSRMSWDNLPEADQPRIHESRSLMAMLGLAPTLLVLIGGMLAMFDVVRGRRRAVYVPLFSIAGVSLAAFSYFAFDAPQFSALKASYLLGLTLPFAAFLARGAEAMERGWHPVVPAALVVVPAAASAVVFADDLWVPTLGDQKAVESARFFLGDREAARGFYKRQQGRVFGGRPWYDELASLALYDGDPFEARAQLEAQPATRGSEPFRWNALAVATALSGQLELALRRADEAVQAGAGEVALVNRGVIHAALEDFVSAEADLRAALEKDPALAPAWHALAQTLDATGREQAAQDAHANAVRAAARAARGYPYGIPNGLGQYPSSELALRFMLWPREDGLALARAPFAAEDAIAMQDPALVLADRPHVVLIVIDTLRADHLGAYGYPRPTSPQIDRLASEGVRFDNVIATSSWTLPSVASLFTSQPPSVHKANRWGRKLDPEMTTFVERLQASGYATVGFSGNFVHITGKNRFDQGFDHFESVFVEIDESAGEALFEKKGVRMRPPSAAELNAAALAALPEPSPKPLFLYMHYMEPHSAYDPPPDKRAAFTREAGDRNEGQAASSERLAQLVRGDRQPEPGERKWLIDLYDAEISVVDEAVGELLEALETRGFGDKLVVAIVGDHGEEFEDHGSWFHGLNLQQASLSIPFVLWDSRGRDAPAVSEIPADLADVATTLLARAGVVRMPGTMGRNLLTRMPIFPRPLHASLGPDKPFERQLRPRLQREAMVLWPWKIIVDSRGRAKLYDLEHDPMEQKAIRPRDPRVPEQVRKRAIELAQRSPARPGARRKQPMNKKEQPAEPGPSQQELEQLRALGYAE